VDDPKSASESHSDLTVAGKFLNLFCLGGNECFHSHDVLLSGAVTCSDFTTNCSLQHVTVLENDKEMHF